MRWKTPSERTQMILLSPALIIAVPIIYVALSPLLLLGLYEKYFPPKRGWKSWFAWRPVRCDGFFYNQPDKWAWLEKVERCGSKYRLPEWSRP